MADAKGNSQQKISSSKNNLNSDGTTMNLELILMFFVLLPNRCEMKLIII